MDLQKCEKCREYYYGDICFTCAPNASTDLSKLDIREQ